MISVWQCSNCGIKMLALVNPHTCSYCGGQTRWLGNSNILTLEMVSRFFKDLEGWRNGDEENLS